MALRIFEGYGGSRFVCDDDGGFGDAVATISRRAHAPINSCAREPAAKSLLQKIGKMDQGTLYQCYLDRLRTGTCPAGCHGNCNPANPPGRSTHERRNDGSAYPGAVGRLLKVWERGIDVAIDRVDEFCAQARKEGWVVTRTYPGVASEAQHVNFRKKPRINIWEVRPLKAGMGANPLDTRRVKWVIAGLKRAHDPQTRAPYLPAGFHQTKPRMGDRVIKALRAFQRDHSQTADGVVGYHTAQQLKVARRRAPRFVSARGVQFIASFEGFRAEAYKPVAAEKYWTIGYGHTGPEVRPGMKWTREHALKVLSEDIDRLTARVRTFDAVRLQQHYDGLGSACFNLGPGVLDADRSLGKALRAKDRPIHKAADALLLYVNGASGPLPGLVRRRKAERRIMLDGNYSTN